VVPALFFINLEYLFRRKVSYAQFLKNKLFSNFIILIFIFGLVIYSTTTRYIPKSKAINDLEFMMQSLENIHPDIYNFISKDSFLVQFNRVASDLPESISETDFHKACARLTSYFGTGHTKPMPNLIGKRMQLIFKRAFPYRTIIIDNRLFVTDNLCLINRIPVGSEITEINGKEINQLIIELSQLVSYENDAFRNSQITQPFNIGLWNNFKQFNIKYKEYVSNEIKEIRAQGGIFSNMYSFITLQKPKKLFFNQISPEIGYIGFFDCHDLKDFQEFFKSTFSELKNKGISNLIIDIRANGGGHTEIGAELMQYIFQQPFKEIDSAIVKVSNELIATGKVVQKLGRDKKEVGKTYTRILEPYQLRDNPFRFMGKTYLLTDIGTFSAGQVFASVYKCYGNGIIIGEETGGITVSFGDVHFFDLPNTGIRIMTSWEKAYSACGVDNRRGVIPDYIVSNSLDDYIEKRDKVLEFTANLINKK
jgi:C-terminal processing protease CtpA/Prc